MEKINFDALPMHIWIWEDLYYSGRKMEYNIVSQSSTLYLVVKIIFTLHWILFTEICPLLIFCRAQTE